MTVNRQQEGSREWGMGNEEESIERGLRPWAFAIVLKDGACTQEVVEAISSPLVST